MNELDKFSPSRIMNGCGYLGIPYNDVLNSPYIKERVKRKGKQINCKNQYDEGVKRTIILGKNKNPLSEKFIETFDKDTLLKLLGLPLFQINDVESELADNETQIEALEKKYKDATPEVIYRLVKRIERGAISKEIKKVYEYKCLLCEALGGETISFEKRKGDMEDEGETYIETHHIIPVSKLEPGSLGISNLVTVCANHHRQFHFGNIEIMENTKDNLKLKIDDNEEVITIKKKVL